MFSATNLDKIPEIAAYWNIMKYTHIQYNDKVSAILSNAKYNATWDSSLQSVFWMLLLHALHRIEDPSNTLTISKTKLLKTNKQEMNWYLQCSSPSSDFFNYLLQHRATQSIINTTSKENLIIITLSTGITNIASIAKDIPGIVEQPTLAALITQNINHHVLCYKNDNITYVFEQGSEINYPKLLCDSLSLLLLNYDYSPEETQLAALIRTYDYTKPVDTLKQKFNEVYNIPELLKNTKTRQIESTLQIMQQTIIKSIEKTIDNHKRRVQEHLDTYMKAFKELTDLERTASTQNIDLKTTKTLLINSKTLTNISLDYDTCTLQYYTPVTVTHNTSVAKNLTDNVLQAVFNTGDYTLYWHAQATLSLKTGDINCNDRYNTSNEIKNTHWTSFNCFGDNKRTIKQAMIKNDYFTAFAIIETAAGMLNIYDATVFNKLCDELKAKPNLKCYEKNGTFYSYNEIKEMLTNANTN